MRGSQPVLVQYVPMAKGGILKEFGAVAPRLSRAQLGWILLGLLIVAVIAYGQTLGMYFWQDDAALVFKMQHPLPNSGSFGAGYYGVGAYKYLATPFIPLYPLFGMNPQPYFAVGLGIYIVLTWIVFWFVRTISQSNRIAVSAAALFGAGYFAQLAIFRLINSYQTNLGVMLALATFGVLFVYFLTRRWQWYVGALLLFAATLELVLVRSHGLILPVVALELLCFRPGKTWRETLLRAGWSLLRIVPFAAVYAVFYFDPRNESSSGALGSLVKTYLVDGKWENFFGLAASFGNTMVPDRLILWLSDTFGQPIGTLTNWSHVIVLVIFLGAVALSQWRLRLAPAFGWLTGLVGLGWFALNLSGAHAQYLWYQDFATILAGTVGGLLLVYFVGLGVALWNRERLLAIAILFSVVWSIANYFGYFVLYPTSVMTSVSRYIMHSFVATVALWAILVELMLARPLRGAAYAWVPTAVATGVLMLAPLWLTMTDQREWVATKSEPTRAFYEKMLEFYPELEYGALIWYDTKRDPSVEYAFGDFFSVGSMPDETALAIYYGIDRYDLKLSSSANNFLGEAFHWKKPSRMLYSFYYDGAELHNTTAHTRAALSGELAPVPVVFDGATGTPEQPVGMSTPVIFHFDVSASVKPANELQAPSAWTGDVSQLPSYFDYLGARDQLRRSASASVSSEWSGSEKEFLADGNYELGWAAHRTIWPVEGSASATLEFPVALETNRVLWWNSHTIRTPRDYRIEVSSNGNNWTTVKEVLDGPERNTGELVAEDFEPIRAKFVRMMITESATGEAPGLIELEVVPTQYGRLDPALAQLLQGDPLLGAQDDASRQSLARYLESHAQLGIGYETDRAPVSQHDPITVPLSASSGSYSVVLPASGTTLRAVQLQAPNYLTSIEASNARVSFPTLSDLNERGFIERRSKN